MAPSHTVEQAEQHLKAPSVAEPTARGVAWKFTIDGNLVMIAGLLALALAAFGYLNGRIDRLDTKIDSVGSDLRSEIKQLNTDMKRYSERTDDRIKQLGEEMKRYSERTDDKIDKLTDKIKGLSLIRVAETRCARVVADVSRETPLLKLCADRSRDSTAHRSPCRC